MSASADVRRQPGLLQRAADRQSSRPGAVLAPSTNRVNLYSICVSLLICTLSAGRPFPKRPLIRLTQGGADDFGQSIDSSARRVSKLGAGKKLASSELPNPAARRSSLGQRKMHRELGAARNLRMLSECFLAPTFAGVATLTSQSRPH